MLSQSITPASVYNKLLGVEQANKNLKECKDYESIFENIGRLLFNNNLHQIIGISLLHRHNFLENNELMLQRTRGGSEGDISLVTTKESVVSINETLYPLTWRCMMSGEVEPLEYTTLSEVELSRDFFAINKHVFSDIATILSQFNNALPIGLTFLNKFILDASSKGFIATENIDLDHEAQIVSLSRVGEEGAAIITNWNYHGTEIQRCIPYKQCVDLAPGHDVTNGHEFIDE